MNFKSLSITLIGISLIFFNHVNAKQEKVESKKEVIHPFNRGAEAWAENCARCHNFRGAKEFTADQWPLIMMHMRIQAQLAGQTARDILVFLAGSTELSPKVTEQIVDDASSEKTKEKPKDADMKPAEIKNAFKNHKDSKTEKNKDSETAKTKDSDAEKLFNQDCAMCHGKDGKGKIAGTPNFTSDSSPFKTLKGDDLFNRVKNGYKAMPAKGGHQELSDEKIREILEYMKKKFSN